MERNTLYYGDCLEVMRPWHDNSIDIICLDPPFNSNERYSSPFKKSGLNIDAQIKAFDDMWRWDEAAAERVARLTSALANPISPVIAGFELFIPNSKMLAYTSYMAERLLEMHRLLKPTGSIFLHCDPTASHYLKILMDVIFGAKNFRNEIVWCYTGPSRAMRWFPRKHDTILFYAASEAAYFYPDAVRMPYKANWTPARGVHGTRYADDTKSRTRHEKGRVPTDWWADGFLSNVSAYVKELLGYPTQKPMALLERIIKASSKPGELVLDPFCGCGTTIEAARTLGRDVIGIDVLPSALDIINTERLTQNKGIAPLKITGTPTDLASAQRLALESRYKFQDWAISLIKGFASNAKKSGDGGIDGFGLLTHAPDNFASRAIVIQVKSGRVGPNDVPSFIYTMDKVNAAMGIFITMTPHRSPKDLREAASLTPLHMGVSAYPRLQFFSVAEYYENSAQLQLPALSNPWTGKPMQGSLFDKLGK